MDIKFSIVIPVYNGEKYIETSILSIINQTYKNYEIIVINDGSTDNTDHIILSLIKKYPNIDILYKAISNSGPSTARNIGINMASGDYICFLDSDDYYEKTLFEELAKMDNLGDVCFFGWVEEDEETLTPFSYYTEKFLFIENPLSGIEVAKLKFRKKLWLCNCNEVYSLKMIKDFNILYPEGIYAGEDTNFIYTCLLNSKIVTSLPKNYFHNTFRKNSLMHSTFSEKYLTEFSSLSQLIEYSELNKFDSELTNMFKNLLYYSRISIAKRIAKTYNCFNFVKFSTDCKKYITIKKPDGIKVLFSRKQKIENLIFNISKPLFLIMCKIVFKLKEKK